MSKNRIFTLSAAILLAVIAFGICPHKAVKAAGTEADAKAVITKVLRMDSHVTRIPEMDFTFQFTKVSLDKNENATADMPDIANQTITYKTEDMPADAGAGSIISIRKQTGGGTQSFLPACNVADGFKKAGIYMYRIKELKDNTTIPDGRLNQSEAEYEMTVFVIKKPDSNELYISNVIVQRTTDDDGTDIDDVKIKNPGEDTAGNPNDFIFTNDYIKYGGTTQKNTGGSDTPDNPDNPDDPGNAGIDKEPKPGEDRGALKIFKTVSGDMGDKRKDFTFTLTLTKASALEPANASYTGTIKRADGSQSTESFGIGTSKTFTLKHNEYIYFTDIPVGTTFTVTEEAGGYEMTQTTISDGKSLTPAAQENVLVGEDYNIVGFNNELEAGALTGIIVNNLPFVLLIVIAVSGFAVVLISKRRRMKG